MVLASLTPQNEQFRELLDHAVRKTPHGLYELRDAGKTYLKATQLTFDQGIDAHVEDVFQQYRQARAKNAHAIIAATASGIGTAAGIAGFLKDYQPEALTLGLTLGVGTYCTLMGVPHLIDKLAPDKRKKAQLRSAAIIDAHHNLVDAALGYERATQSITRTDRSGPLHRRVLDSYFTLDKTPAHVPARPRTLRLPRQPNHI